MFDTKNWFSKSKYADISIPKPMVQGGFVLTIAMLMMLGGFVMEGDDWPWTVAGALLLLFTVFNNALGIFANKFSIYFQYSAYTFMGLMLILGLTAFGISGKSIFAGKGENQTIFLVLILAHFSLLAIAFMIRNVADFLKTRDEEMQKKGRL